MFAGTLSGERGIIEAMPYVLKDNEWAFEWQAPASVISIVDGACFVADIDLGWGVHKIGVVICEGIEVDEIETPEGLAARKEAQRLLTNATLSLRCRRLTPEGAVCEVTYSPYFTPRSEQASFAAAMLASGYARRSDER